MNTLDKESLRRDPGPLEQALKSAGATVIGRRVKCPFHDDRTPSGSIHQSADGVWRFRCHTCDITEDAIGVQAKAQQKTSGDVLKQIDPARPIMDVQKPPRVFRSISDMLGSIAAYATVDGHWIYGEEERVDMVVIRKSGADGKSYLQAKPVDGGFVMRAPEKPWPIYNRTRAKAADVVIVCEGEKCVHAFHDLGFTATTSPGGAGKAGYADWTALSGCTTVYLWPDNDDAGRKHMDDVAEILGKLPKPPQVFRVDTAKLNLPLKGDVVELVTMNPEDAAVLIQTAMDVADTTGPAAKVGSLIRDTISGRRSSAPWPHNLLTGLTQALLPGTISILCGDGGSTKTFFLLQCAAHWQNVGIPWAMQELEEDEEGSTLLRVLAQRDKNPDLTSVAWVNQHPDEANAAHQTHRAYLDAFGKNLWAIPGNMPTLSDLTDWARDRAKEGRRVIVIDPITAADSVEKPWIEDKRFVRTVQTVMRDHRASLVIATHPKQGRKSPTPTMDDVAGGAAYQRFTQNVFWLRKVEEPEPVNCRIRSEYTGWMNSEIEINRTLKIFKARNGTGAGLTLGYIFGHDLCFTEQGIVMKPEHVSPRFPSAQKTQPKEANHEQRTSDE